MTFPAGRPPMAHDPSWFSPQAVPLLRVAVSQVRWLLDQGFPLNSALRFVCDHHQLVDRQRLAVLRCSGSTHQHTDRLQRRLTVEQARGQCWGIDGFNLLISLEVALSKGVLLRSLDGTLRDLAGLRGSYHIIDQTLVALQLVYQTIKRIAPKQVVWYLDSPVSHSGQLRKAILDLSASFAIPITVHLVADADSSVASSQVAISSDGGVLDRCGSWYDLLSDIVQNHVPDAWIVDLRAVEAPWPRKPG